MDTIYFTRNFPDLTFQAPDGGLTIQVMDEDTTILLEESYTADPDGLVTVRLREFFESLIQHEIAEFPDQSVRNYGYKTYNILDVYNTLNYQVVFVKGGISEGASSEVYIKSNFLTAQPQILNVRETDRQFLSYFAINTQSMIVKIKAWGDESNDEVDLYTLNDGLNLFDTSWAYMRSLCQAQGITDIDVWVEVDGVATNMQRYHLVDDSWEFEDQIVFVNSQGGIDIILLTGERKEISSNEFSTAVFLRDKKEYENAFSRYFEKNTGPFYTKDSLSWLSDFFSSLIKYLIVPGSTTLTLGVGGTLLPVNFRKQEFKFLPGRVSSFDFEFELQKDDNRVTKSRENLKDPNS